ncbi:MAG: hypothetical protein IPK24_03235 [Kineosporiaceae bacterium]|nr:hypothetical protein [Kineosporiaceae bacterium]MBK8074586.1 hypothetical protein [Kineosporiaceae bacterium]
MTWQSETSPTDDRLGPLTVPLALGVLTGVLVGLLGFTVIALTALTTTGVEVTNATLTKITFGGMLSTALAALLAGVVTGVRARRRPASARARGLAAGSAALLATVILLGVGLIPHTSAVTAPLYLLCGLAGAAASIRITGGRLRG